MRTDDDIFESLDIGGSADDDIFEELDMEDRIFSNAFDDGNAGSAGAGAGRDRQGRAGTGAKRAPKELNTAETVVDQKKAVKEKEKKKKSGIKKIIIASIVEIFTLGVIFAYGYFLRNWNLISRPDVELGAIENNNISLEKKKEMEGYWNVAVFGVDSRGNTVVERGINSDVIMIVSVNRDTGEIKMVSVFRDTYLNISSDNSYNKINQAYSYGGPEQALAALNKNLDLNITNYVAFNWKAVADGINILGGVDNIPISSAELYYINAYITETVKATKIGSVQLTHTGEQHLDGVQAVAYGRLRNMDNDFARTERQKNVIKAAFEKAKKADFSVLNNIMVVCFPQVATNVEFNDVVELAGNITKYNLGESGGFPWSRGDANIGNKGDCVIPTTLESNVIKLHEFLFGDENYAPSDSVMAISEKIKSDSNLYKEGKFIESVSTDGGVIQRPKTARSAEDTDDGDDEDDDGEEVTLGIDEEGNYIYPTDEDGNIVIPTDEDGEVIYPTDENGDIIRESSRPTEVLEGNGSPGESNLAPGDLPGMDDDNLRPGDDMPSRGDNGPLESGGLSSRPGESGTAEGVQKPGSATEPESNGGASGGSDVPGGANTPGGANAPGAGNVPGGSNTPGAGNVPGAADTFPGANGSGSANVPEGTGSGGPGGRDSYATYPGPGSNSSGFTDGPGSSVSDSPASPGGYSPGSPGGSGSPSVGSGPGSGGSATDPGGYGAVVSGGPG